MSDHGRRRDDTTRPPFADIAVLTGLTSAVAGVGWAGWGLGGALGVPWATWFALVALPMSLVAAAAGPAGAALTHHRDRRLSTHLLAAAPGLAASAWASVTLTSDAPLAVGTFGVAAVGAFWAAGCCVVGLRAPAGPPAPTTTAPEART